MSQYPPNYKPRYMQNQSGHGAPLPPPPPGSGISYPATIGNTGGFPSIGQLPGFSAANLTAGSVALTASKANASVLVAGRGSPKDNICYVIVMEDGSCLELEEQTPITPREMIGIVKFLTIVQSVMQAPVEVEWLDLIANLGIDHHFVGGEDDHHDYDNTDSTLYIKLFSPKP